MNEIPCKNCISFAICYLIFKDCYSKPHEQCLRNFLYYIVLRCDSIRNIIAKIDNKNIESTLSSFESIYLEYEKKGNEVPCKQCITFAVCYQIYLNNSNNKFLFVQLLFNKCSLIGNYVKTFKFPEPIITIYQYFKSRKVEKNTM